MKYVICLRNSYLSHLALCDEVLECPLTFFWTPLFPTFPLQIESSVRKALILEKGDYSELGIDSWFGITSYIMCQKAFSSRSMKEVGLVAGCSFPC